MSRAIGAKPQPFAQPRLQAWEMMPPMASRAEGLTIGCPRVAAWTTVLIAFAYKRSREEALEDQWHEEKPSARFPMTRVRHIRIPSCINGRAVGPLRVVMT